MNEIIAIVVVLILLLVFGYYFIYIKAPEPTIPVATTSGVIEVPGGVVVKSSGVVTTTDSVATAGGATTGKTSEGVNLQTEATQSVETKIIVAPAAIVGSDGYMRIVSKNGKVALFNEPRKQITAVSVDAAGCASGTTKDGCLWKVNEHGFTVSKANPTMSLTSYGGVTLNTECHATATNLNPRCKVTLYPDGRLTNTLQEKTGGAFAKAVGDLVVTDNRCKEGDFEAEGCTWEFK